MEMPEINGVETYKRLLNIDPNVKVMVATGYADQNEIDQIKNLGVKKVIRKPFQLSDLKQELEQLLYK